DIEALPAISHRPDQDRFPRPIVIARIGLRSFMSEIAFQGNEIKSGRGEVAYFAFLLMSHVAGHRESFEINFRPHNCRAEIQHDSSFKTSHGLSENQEITITGSSQSGSIAIWMFMQNVIADSDMDSDGNAQAHPRSEDADIFMREGSIKNSAAK